MIEPETLSRRRRLRFWGWGYADEGLAPEEEARARASAARYAKDGLKEVAPPTLDDFDLRSPRIAAPPSLAPIVSASPYDRLTHAYGKSFPDVARMLMRSVPHPPDLVAFPRTEREVVDVIDWASGANVAIIPFGGGSSVCGGVEPDVGDGYAATISLDTQHLCHVLEIDRASRAARIQAGALGPELEDQLRPHGLTLRHFPQSFQLSTLGGWIATRSGGHFASLYTHIDDFVESLRLATPSGVLETRRLPGSGAGPAPDRMVIGSEGVFGVITEAWMRLQDRPRFQATASVAFATMQGATAAVRALTQSGLFPSNCRLLDPAEAQGNGVGDGTSAILVLGFESADHPLDAWVKRALELTADHGGVVAAPQDAGRDQAAGVWRNAFIRMPFNRNLMVALGVIGDTFETAVTWDRFDGFYEEVRARTKRVIGEVCGHEANVSCRFTHVYPDGPAPYFSFSALGTASGNLADSVAKWRDIKRATNQMLVEFGGTVTHHHAVGRDHRPGYEAETAPLFRQALAAAKQTLDPKGVMNPGVLIDPVGRTVGVRGVMREPHP